MPLLCTNLHRWKFEHPEKRKDAGQVEPVRGGRALLELPVRGVPGLRVPRLDPVLHSLGPRRRAVGAERLAMRDG